MANSVSRSVEVSTRGFFISGSGSLTTAGSDSGSTAASGSDSAATFLVLALCQFLQPDLLHISLGPPEAQCIYQ